MRTYYRVQITIMAVSLIGLLTISASSQATPPTFIKLVDTTDQVPDRPTDTLFQLFGVPALDGNRVAFNVYTQIENTYSIWSMDALAGLPSLVRLVDTNTLIPQGTGNFTERFHGNPFTSPKAKGGKVVFGGAGTNPENTGRNQSGFYSVPSTGGAVTILVNSSMTAPGVTPAAPFDINLSNYPFNLDANNLVFGFDGSYAVTLNGGPVTNLGTSFLCTNGYGFTFGVNSYYAPDVSGSTIALRMSNVQGLPAIVTGPLTGIVGTDQRCQFLPDGQVFHTGGSSEFNATFIATLNDTVPGDPNSGKFTNFYPPLIDGNKVIFLGYSGVNFSGFYSSIPDPSGTRQLRKLVDTNTPVPGGTGNFKEFITYDYNIPSSYSFSGDRLVFIGRDSANKDGIYWVSTTDGSVSKIIAVGDSLGDGRTVLRNGGDGVNESFDGPIFGNDSLKENRFAFRVNYADAAKRTQGAAIYLVNLLPGSVEATLTATPATGNSQGPKTLTWSSSNATSCNATTNTGLSLAVPLSGNAVVSPPASTTYTLTCTGPDGTFDRRSVTVPAVDPIACLLNWVETSYPNLFSPAGATTQKSSPFTYRFYRDTNAYVGIYSANNDVYYLGPDRVLQNVGGLNIWLPQAGCQ